MTNSVIYSKSVDTTTVIPSRKYELGINDEVSLPKLTFVLANNNFPLAPFKNSN